MKNKLELKNVAVKAGDFIVSDINLSIKNNQYFVLMGNTGSGKSMLLKAICGLMQVSAGEIKIDDIDVTNNEPRFRNIGYVPQNSSLFPHLTVIQNIIFSQTLIGIPKQKAIKEASKTIDFFDISYLLERSVLNLSGGEKQKVALARAIVKKPDLLLLDEPVSALDEPTRFEFCKILKDLQKEFKLTTIHVSHNIEEAKAVSDFIGIMSDGKLLKTGLLEDLIKDENKIIHKILHPKDV